MKRLILGTFLSLALLSSCTRQQDKRAAGDNSMATAKSDDSDGVVVPPATDETAQAATLTDNADMPTGTRQTVNQSFADVAEQGFEIDTEKESTIHTNSGSTFIIPPGSLVLPNGQPATGKAEVTIQEAMTISDFIRAGLQTTSDGKLLASGGMYCITASQNGQQLSIQQGSEVQAKFASLRNDEDMQMFYGTKTANGSINWLPETRQIVRYQTAGDLAYNGENSFFLYSRKVNPFIRYINQDTSVKKLLSSTPAYKFEWQPENTSDSALVAYKKEIKTVIAQNVKRRKELELKNNLEINNKLQAVFKQELAKVYTDEVPEISFIEAKNIDSNKEFKRKYSKKNRENIRMVVDKTRQLVKFPSIGAILQADPTFRTNLQIIDSLNCLIDPTKNHVKKAIFQYLCKAKTEAYSKELQRKYIPQHWNPSSNSEMPSRNVTWKQFQEYYLSTMGIDAWASCILSNYLEKPYAGSLEVLLVRAMKDGIIPVRKSKGQKMKLMAIPVPNKTLWAVTLEKPLEKYLKMFPPRKVMMETKITRFGYYNCDRFVNQQMFAVQGTVQLPANFTENKVEVFLVSKKEKIVLSQVLDKNSFTFNFPANIPFDIIVLSGNEYLTIQPAKIKNDNLTISQLALRQHTPQEVATVLDGL